MNKIENPIIRGFNPDPSIVRVEDDYYIVTSTFEWFPGYQIHHSKDLKNWKLINRPLDRVSQLDMKGVPDSCGVWAPCITHHEGVFYLLYTNVKSFNGEWKDTPNYVVTATDIMGPWSEPVYLNSSGFDSSFFHDDDGKTWLVNMVMDHREKKFFGGLLLQEYSKEEKKLIGEIHYIFPGTDLGCTEGPHLYKLNGWYYLITAEGGTGYNHAVTIARSRNITGPYVVHPENPVISSRAYPQNYIQKTGHCDIVQLPDGDWYMVFLGSRPITERGRCILGRETCIEKVEWREDGWLYLAHGGKTCRREVEAPNLPEHTWEKEPVRIDFDKEEMDINFQALRIPMSEDWVTLKERPGYLRLYGRESLSSTFEQSHVARRVQAHHTEASTCLEFSPKTYQQMAGLVCYYNTVHYHYLHVTSTGDGSKKYLTIISCDNFETIEPIGRGIDITGFERVFLRAEFNYAEIQFYYALEEEKWMKVGPKLDGSILSDDYVENFKVRLHPCFTGAFYGLCCQDLSGQRLPADFDYFEYIER